MTSYPFLLWLWVLVPDILGRLEGAEAAILVGSTRWVPNLFHGCELPTVRKILQARVLETAATIRVKAAHFRQTAWRKRWGNELRRALPQLLELLAHNVGSHPFAVAKFIAAKIGKAEMSSPPKLNHDVALDCVSNDDSGLYIRVESMNGVRAMVFGNVARVFARWQVYRGSHAVAIDAEFS